MIKPQAVTMKEGLTESCSKIPDAAHIYKEIARDGIFPSIVAAQDQAGKNGPSSHVKIRKSSRGRGKSSLKSLF
jgi:hypothetical protein